MQRWWKKKDTKMRENIERELRTAIGAFQPDALNSAQQKLVDELKVFITRKQEWPKRNGCKSPDGRTENRLAQRWWANGENTREAIEHQLRPLGVVYERHRRHGTTIQNFVDAVKELGHYPREFSKPSNEEEKNEALLAVNIRKARAAKRSTPEQWTELDDLKRASVHTHDRGARRPAAKVRRKDA